MFYLVSFPKSGRTWLRMLIGRALQMHYQLPEDVDIIHVGALAEDFPNKGIPSIIVKHDLALDNPSGPFRAKPSQLKSSKKECKGEKIIFLSRDPRDVLVSSYFEKKKRSQMIWGRAAYEGNLSDYTREKRGGFDTIIKFFNLWADLQKTADSFLLVRYEDLRKNGQLELRRILNFIGLSDAADETIDEAVQYCSFENMREMEKSDKYDSEYLSTKTPEDPESFKTRKGKVGGFVDYLTEDEIKRLDKKMKKLSKIFGYCQK